MKSKIQFLLLMFALACVAAAKADQFDVTLDTSTLSGTQVLAFGFTNGDGALNNTATMSSFNFGGGSATAGTADCTLGGALSGTGCSGDAASTVTMQDNDFTAIFTQSFTPGTSTSFLLSITNNFSGSGAPDQLSVYVCDTSLNCYSDDTSTGAMLTLDLNGSPITVSSFTLNGSTDQGLAAPIVTPVTEPSSLLLFGTIFTGFAWRLRPRQQT